MDASGRARVEQELRNESVLVSTGTKGVIAVIGQTQRGIVGQSTLVSSWAEYKNTFGGILSTSDFPHLCKRALDGGAKLRVARAGNYTDVTDASTLTGSKAAFTAVVGTGVPLDLKASSEGTWGNGINIKLTESALGSSTQADFHITVDSNSSLNRIITINRTITQDDINKIKNTEILETTSAVGTVIEAEDMVDFASLSGGTDIAAVTATDIAGDLDAGTGLHVFDEHTDFTKICIPEFAIPAIDNSLVEYVKLRKDCRAILRTPIGISGKTAVEYRDRTGSYTGTALDTYLCSMYFGEITVYDPVTAGVHKNISSIGDVLAAISNTESKHRAWYSVAGSKRGRLSNILRVVYNLGSPTRGAEFDLVDSKGINPVINDKDYGVVIWGNGTMDTGNTLLKHDNVANFLVYLSRLLAPLVKSELFEPNDVETWKAIYRKVNPVMRDLKTERAIWDYTYEGDQFVESVNEAVINKASDIDAGKYVFHLGIQPKVGLKYINLQIVVTNSGVSLISN